MAAAVTHVFQNLTDQQVIDFISELNDPDSIPPELAEAIDPRLTTRLILP